MIAKVRTMLCLHTGSFKTSSLAYTILGVTMLALVTPASAQQSGASARTAKPDQDVEARPALKPAQPVLPAAAPQNVKTSAKRNTKANSKTPDPQGRPWTLEDAMPAHSAAMRQDDLRPASPGIGRVPLQSGSVGFETKTQVNPNQTPDGATIRGHDATAARPSSYLGMSLSVPTDEKAMNFPLPWGKP